ncbi:uncharacterized protein LOC105701287 isoform X2 [Orussus abietinus]|uniref:uncharacterized protein LOC105701287 isoform X2 n=1 Tax=Orussus abietinus TaxID=222816 RepID=UPI00062628A4|nr:uncharacterized protein LOC105701287 isoform X2 [Orussus abietinus]
MYLVTSVTWLLPVLVLGGVIKEDPTALPENEFGLGKIDLTENSSTNLSTTLPGSSVIEDLQRRILNDFADFEESTSKVPERPSNDTQRTEEATRKVRKRDLEPETTSFADESSSSSTSPPLEEVEAKSKEEVSTTEVKNDISSTSATVPETSDDTTTSKEEAKSSTKGDNLSSDTLEALLKNSTVVNGIKNRIVSDLINLAALANQTAVNDGAITSSVDENAERTNNEEGSTKIDDIDASTLPDSRNTSSDLSDKNSTNQENDPDGIQLESRISFATLPDPAGNPSESSSSVVNDSTTVVITDSGTTSSTPDITSVIQNDEKRKAADPEVQVETQTSSPTSDKNSNEEIPESKKIDSPENEDESPMPETSDRLVANPGDPISNLTEESLSKEEIKPDVSQINLEVQDFKTEPEEIVSDAVDVQALNQEELSKLNENDDDTHKKVPETSIRVPKRGVKSNQVQTRMGFDFNPEPLVLNTEKPREEPHEDPPERQWAPLEEENKDLINESPSDTSIIANYGQVIKDIPDGRYFINERPEIMDYEMPPFWYQPIRNWETPWTPYPRKVEDKEPVIIVINQCPIDELREVPSKRLRKKSRRTSSRKPNPGEEQDYQTLWDYPLREIINSRIISAILKGLNVADKWVLPVNGDNKCKNFSRGVPTWPEISLEPAEDVEEPETKFTEALTDEWESAERAVKQVKTSEVSQDVIKETEDQVLKGPSGVANLNSTPVPDSGTRRKDAKYPASNGERRGRTSANKVKKSHSKSVKKSEPPISDKSIDDNLKHPELRTGGRKKEGNFSRPSRDETPDKVSTTSEDAPILRRKSVLLPNLHIKRVSNGKKNEFSIAADSDGSIKMTNNQSAQKWAKVSINGPSGNLKIKGKPGKSKRVKGKVKNDPKLNQKLSIKVRVPKPLPRHEDNVPERNKNLNKIFIKTKSKTRVKGVKVSGPKRRNKYNDQENINQNINYVVNVRSNNDPSASEDSKNSTKPNSIKSITYNIPPQSLTKPPPGKNVRSKMYLEGFD